MESKLPEEIRKEIRNESSFYANMEVQENPQLYVSWEQINRAYTNGANEWAPWKVKYDELKEKYDNILATESGFESKTENVWQSGYAAGHDAGYEKWEKERVQRVHLEKENDLLTAKANELVAENERLKADFRKAIDDFRGASVIVLDAKEQVEKERDNLQAVYTALFNTAQTSAVKHQQLKERCEKMEAENERIKIALENVYLIHSDQWTEYDRKVIKDLIKKEGESNTRAPVPTISKCGMCKKEGVNQYLSSQFYLCDECFIDYENSRDQPQQ